MKKILLIEDNTEMRENTAEILELANYKVITAKDGKVGIKMATNELPDLIICDVMMPELDGFGVLHLLAQNPNAASIPFIFLTAKTERGDVRKGMEMGADDYLTKPFDDVELLKAVESRLKRNECLKEKYSKPVESLYNFLDNTRTLDQFNKISDGKKILKYQKKEIIYKEGNYPNGVYVLLKGKVKTVKTNEQGKDFITSLYKEGDFFGYIDLLEDLSHQDSAAALEDSEIAFIPKEDFFSLISKNTQVASQFIKLLANNVLEKEKQLLNLAYNSVRKRVAESLIQLADRYSSDKVSNTFKITISREDLANMTGTSTETAIRTLSDFKEEKLIEMKGSTITILDKNKLEKMKN